MNNGNTIELVKSDGARIFLSSIPGVSINFHGKNNHIIIHEGTKFKNCAMIFISNMHIEIKNSTYELVNLKIFGNHSEVLIGKNFSCWGVEIRCHEVNTSVKIGDDCMFSEDILIYPTDVHSIYEQETGKLLNLGGHVTIGNHVWCERDVKFKKNTQTGNDVVIAMGSLISKPFTDNNVILSGNPAGNPP